MNSTAKVPQPQNEPVFSYAPGTPERALLKKTLESMSKTPVREGLDCSRQNAFPSGGFDVLAAADFFFAKGMDHHTMFTSPRALNAVMQKVVRQLGGLGRLPDATEGAPPALPAPTVREVDAVVVGA